MINIKGVEMKNLLSDFTIKEYEVLSGIFNSDAPTISKYIDIYVIGSDIKDENILSELSFNTLKEYIESISVNEESFEIQRVIEIDNRRYISTKDEDEFEFKAKDVELIEKAIKKDKDKYILEMAAIIFKDDQLGYKEHYDQNHINHKKVLFSKLSASIIQPYVSLLLENILQKNEYLKEQSELTNIITEIDEFRKNK